MKKGTLTREQAVTDGARMTLHDLAANFAESGCNLDDWISRMSSKIMRVKCGPDSAYFSPHDLEAALRFAHCAKEAGCPSEYDSVCEKYANNIAVWGRTGAVGRFGEDAIELANEITAF